MLQYRLNGKHNSGLGSSRVYNWFTRRVCMIKTRLIEEEFVVEEAEAGMTGGNAFAAAKPQRK